MSLLKLDAVTVTLNTLRGPASAVRDLSFELEKGETLGLVGESGCGKSMTALAIMGLLPENGWAEGSIFFDEKDLLRFKESEMCKLRGNHIGMIFQEPMTSLNPLHTVGRQIAEAIALHKRMPRDLVAKEVERLLDMVGIADPKKRFYSYPHQLSGGQRQRVMIAMALSCDPKLLIADEPTTALDVTIQKQILDLIANLVNDLGMAMILISHDLGVIANNVKTVIVMYGGSCVERGPTGSVFKDIAHPYTQGLFAAVPQLDAPSTADGRLLTIPGTVPELVDLPYGCAFQDRCPLVTDSCRSAPPKLTLISEHHAAACIHIDEAREGWGV